MDTKTRVIVVGIDGATWDLIIPLVKKGKMPTFKKLMKEGVWGLLESTEPPISSASWTTITTGVNPGKHGIFDFSRRKDGTYEIRPLSSKDVRVPRVWDILGYYGKKVYIINVPMTYPPKKVNGALISGFPCPEDKNDFSYPPRFIEELRAKIDRDIHFQNRISPHQEREFFEEMMKITDYLAETVNYILKNKEFDFLMSVFTAPDAVGHVFFKYLDENHPKFENKKEFVDAYFSIYTKLDEILESILNRLKENDKLLIVSDHGFTSVYYGVALNKWLMEKGYLRLKRRPSTLFKRFLFNLGITPENLFRIAKKLNLVKKAQEEAYRESKSFIRKIVDFITIGWDDIDWSKTKAYSQGNFGQIFINLKGREPQGCVTLEEYNDIVDKIISDLKELRFNGERVFDIIKRRDEVYKGDFVKYAPDIICLHSNSKFVVSRFFEFGSRKIITIHPVWSGTHDKFGIFLAWDGGKDINEGKNITAKVEDVTPTVLYMFGIPIPKYMDGRVLTEIFKVYYITTRKISYNHPKRDVRNRTREVVKMLRKEKRL